MPRTRAYPEFRFILAALIAGFLAAVPAWPDPSPEGGEEVAVHLQFLATSYGFPTEREGTYGPTEQKASGDTHLRYGETGYVYLGAGSFDGEGLPRPNNLLVQSMSGGVPADGDSRQARERLLDRCPLAWWAEVTPRRTEFGKVRLDVRWERIASERRGEPRVTASGTRTVEMLETEHHVLDFVAGGTDEAPGRHRNVIVRIAAEVREDPALEDTALRYSLWLRHRSNGEETPTRRILLVGRQGEEVKFRFLPLRFGLTDVPKQDGRPLELVMDVSGAVRGRRRPDGSFELRLAGSRMIGITPQGEARSGGIGWNGVKLFAVAPGESVALEFPAPEGRVAMAAGQPGVVLADYFAGSDTSIILTVDNE